MRQLAGWLLVLLLAAAGSLTAHDLWLEPSEFAPRPGRPVGIGLWVGDRFDGDPVPRPAAGTDRFSVLGPAGEQALAGVEGVHPAGLLTPRVAGPHWLVYESRPRQLTLAAERFESYLREEGLDLVVSARRERSQSERPGRESYRRCAKSLLEVGGEGDGSGFDRAAGCALELLLEGPPRVGGAGELAVRLHFHGRPVAGARVRAWRRSASGEPLEARTDGEGRALFEALGSGVWLFRTVHMEPAAAGDREADWQSWWASLTVRLTAAAGPAAAR